MFPVHDYTGRNEEKMVSRCPGRSTMYDCPDKKETMSLPDFLLQTVGNSSKLRGAEAHGDNRQRALRDAYRWGAGRR
jgi:hypothetical protein